MTINYFKIAEFFLIFILMPILFLVQVIPLYAVVVVLWFISVYAYYRLKKNNPYKLFKRFNVYILYLIVIRFILITPFLISFTYAFYEEKLFAFMLEHTAVYCMILILYPLLSVIPQELIFRKFFFERYHFNTNAYGILVFNALIFGWTHIIFQNYIAVLFTIVGGYMFAHTYKKSKSFSLVCIEHSLYGNLLFTIGLGDFFYHNGNIG